MKNAPRHSPMPNILFGEGENYVVEETRVGKSIGLMKKMAEKRPNKMFLTLTDMEANKFRKKFGIDHKNVFIISLRGTILKETPALPEQSLEVGTTYVEKVNRSIMDFCKKNKEKAVVLIVACEEITMNNSFKILYSMLSVLREMTEDTKSTMIIALNPEAYTPKEYAVIEHLTDQTLIFE